MIQLRRASIIVLVLSIAHPGDCVHSDNIPKEQLKTLFTNMFLNLKNFIVKQTDLKGLFSDHKPTENVANTLNSAAIESNLTHLERNITELLTENGTYDKHHEHVAKLHEALHIQGDKHTLSDGSANVTNTDVGGSTTNNSVTKVTSDTTTRHVDVADVKTTKRATKAKPPDNEVITRCKQMQQFHLPLPPICTETMSFWT